ncbi:cytochrome c [Geothrix rubra]|uniref:Cytochrome c n=1 Tax=Geothrix rubra TaxID=2927977 RepID=A0ABQ5Q5T2_9BACT|nr:tetrathionate reductase family octaheme c-type cytochrome [Geothrix rubra]GLH69704.1 cytochrome c [Geothrix rubra]
MFPSFQNPSPPRLRWVIQTLAGLLCLAQVQAWAQQPAPSAPAGHGAFLEVHRAKGRRQTADHSKFKILQGPFKEGDGPAVTRACLTCHTKAAEQVMATSHWTWNVADHGKDGFGKSTHLVNNYCISIIGGNTESCARCHIGYGFKDKTFDFTRQENVDCLVCHDTTGDYEKEKAGLPNPGVDLAAVAQKVGEPTNRNCGVCHFFGGGGDATKHGDLDDTILKAPRSEDVHMSRQGAGMECVDCHVSDGHRIAGPNYVVPADRREQAKYPGEAASRMSCTACHSDSPHKSYILNRHYQKVACQTCHIPAFARGELPTNLYWDWETAGRLKNGRPYQEEDAKGFEGYNSIHGEMVWDRNVKPTYLWYNGNLAFVRLTDSIQVPADGKVVLNPAEGSYADPNAKIWPFKLHDGRQPFDTVLNRFVAPYTAGPKGSGAYWGDWNWEVAIRKGMETAGLPYSGKYGFVKTTMLWPITHMVAPKEQALSCLECHRRNGRLQGVSGFYLPGRDRGRGVDFIGLGLILVTGLGVLVHGLMRYFHGHF